MVDVLIVGAGPVGLFLACELTRRGIACRIIDQSAERSHESKALAIMPRTLEIFEMAGVVDPFIRAGSAVRALNIIDARKPLARVSVEALPSAYQFLLMVPQSTTEELLEARLRASNVSVERNVQFLSFSQSDEGVVSTVQGTGGALDRIASQWIVGCDGAHSGVRHAMNLPFTGAPYEEGFVLADVDLQSRTGGDEVFLSIDRTLFGLFPMSASRYRIIMSVEPNDRTVPSQEELQSLFNERVPFEGTIAAVRWTSNFRIHRRMVPQLHYGRAFLAGDSAHIHSPVGGQGINTGLGDAWNIAWKMALVCNEAAPRNLLLTYDEERLPVARAVLKLTNIMTRSVLVLRSPLLRAVRAMLIPRFIAREKLRERLVATLSELDISYAKSSIVFGGGRRPPPGRIREKHSGMAGPIASLLGRNHVLLLWTKPKIDVDQAAVEAAAELKARYRERLDVYTVESATPLAPIVLLRPDGYTGFEGTLTQLDQLRNVLAKTLI